MRLCSSGSFLERRLHVDFGLGIVGFVYFDDLGGTKRLMKDKPKLKPPYGKFFK
jgi:hypothetical protein